MVLVEPLRLFFGVLKIREVRLPVIALRPCLPRKLQQPRPACVVVQPVNAYKQVRPTHLRPALQRLFVQQPIDPAHRPLHGGHDPCISGRLVPLREDLEHDEERPRVHAPLPQERVGIVPLAKPAILGLVLQNVVNPELDLCHQRAVAEQRGEREHAVEPVGTSLPPFGLTTDPPALRNVRPELVQVPAEALGLNL